MGNNNYGKVLSLGALAMDVVINSSELPQDDGFSLVGSEVQVPGGSASNMSVALRKLGANVEQTGKIGDDHCGVPFRKDLIENGVGVKHLVVKPGGTTLHTYIITAPGGRHCIFANLGDCVFDLQPSEVREDILEDCVCFYTDLFSADAALLIADKAKEENIPVVYNLQCTPSFMEACGVSREKNEAMLNKASLLLGGKAALGELCNGETPAEIAQKVFERFHPADGVICTSGSAGSVWYSENGMVEMPAFSIEVVDSTGAGDSFCAGLIYERYYRHTSDREEVLRFASALAAIKCGISGPRVNASAEEVERFLSEAE